jgi:hypothetical protein
MGDTSDAPTDAAFTEERVAELRAIAERMAENPDVINSLSEEDVADLRKYSNPFGSKLRGEEFWTNLSIINWSQSRMKKMLITALIGYIYRLQMEYEPEEEIAGLRKKYDALKENKTIPEREALEERFREETDAITKASRRLILRFLNRHFEFNPDKHLRGAPTNPTGDPEREKLLAEADEGGKIRLQCETIETKIKAKPESLYSFMRGNVLAAHQLSQRASASLARARGVIAAGLPAEDILGVLSRERVRVDAVTAELGKITEPLAAADTLAAWEHKPPADVFHHFTRYHDNHYEQLNDICTAFYNEKPDIEFAVKIYSTHDDPKAAQAYRDMHAKEFTNDVITVSSIGTTLIGPFKQNLDRVDYYTSNTLILREMDEQSKRDHRLGEDLIKKEITKKKRENNEECGPDAPNLGSYTNTNVAAGGKATSVIGKRPLSKEDRERIAKEVAEREDREVPDDAIQVNMFSTEYIDGEARFKREKMYTQAEDPKHLEDPNSQFANAYQPKKMQKTIKSRSGATATIEQGKIAPTPHTPTRRKPLEPDE